LFWDADEWQLYVITEGSLYYEHPKIFYNYEKFEEFALKVKDKGIVNLSYWTCMGSYDRENTFIHEEFEEEDFPIAHYNVHTGVASVLKDIVVS
jgi:hypothetical protein